MRARTSNTARKLPRSRGDRSRGITEDEIKDIEELATPRTPVIYEVVRRLGEEEMERPSTSLWLLAQAILQTHLPNADWQPLVVSFGYCVGFIMAVLSRQQLFTEITITAVAWDDDTFEGSARHAAVHALRILARRTQLERLVPYS